LWSGNPNRYLVSEIADLSPGRALDAGCGEDADAVWLAERGWRVTAVGFSSVALQPAADHARQRGGTIAARIEWAEEDLTTWIQPQALRSCRRPVPAFATGNAATAVVPSATALAELINLCHPRRP